MKDKPLTYVVLEQGQYLVDAHPAFAPRCWKGDGMGTWTGHGSRLRRVAIQDAFRDLTIRAEREEGIDPGSLNHPELVAIKLSEIPREAIDRVELAKAELGRAQGELRLLIENSAEGREYRRRHR